MSEVALPIGGRTYRVACAPGEEERVARLGAVVAEKLAAMGNLSGHEAQNLLFAALLLADEAYEKREGSERSGADVAAAKAEAESAARARAQAEAELAELRDAQRSAADALESASGRIDELSEALAAREAEVGDLANENSALRERLAPREGASAGAAAVSEAELAPALERLAEMLEDCADKLEGSTAAP